MEYPVGLYCDIFMLTLIALCYMLMSDTMHEMSGLLTSIQSARILSHMLSRSTLAYTILFHVMMRGCSYEHTKVWVEPVSLSMAVCSSLSDTEVLLRQIASAREAHLLAVCHEL